MQESALLQKVARHVDLQTPGVHRAARLKEEDGHHQRHGQRACVKAPSHELAHVSATEGTERGRRGGMSSAWVALNEVRRFCMSDPVPTGHATRQVHSGKK